MITRKGFSAVVLGAAWLAGCTAGAGDDTSFGLPAEGTQGMQDSATPAHSGSGHGSGQGSGQGGGSAGSGGAPSPLADSGGQPQSMTGMGDSSVHPSSGSDAGGGHMGMTGMDASMMSMGSADATSDTGASANGETGRLVGMTAAHNAVRAKVSTMPALPQVTWSTTVAEYAQQWATMLASNASTCAAPMHRSSAELQSKDYGENLALFAGGGFGGLPQGNLSTAQQAVDSWASESACWTYGDFMTTDKCNTSCYQNLHSDGCGHYTQIVWRTSIEIGCGVATCSSGGATTDIWICNYSPAGNLVGAPPY